jgi:hypothetical protein
MQSAAWRGFTTGVTVMNSTVQDLINSHIQSVRLVLEQGAPTGSRPVDPAALDCVLRRQVQVLLRCGYGPGELTLLPEDRDWWAVQVVPRSVLRPLGKRPGMRQ